MTTQTSRRGRYRPLDPSRLEDLRRVVGNELPLPSGYPEPLVEMVGVYRQTDRLPKTDFAKLTARPKDQFRMFPSKCRRALGYASPEAKLVFMALWDQHEDRYGRANGLLLGTTEWLQSQTGIGRRNAVSDAVLELEVRGLVRVMRGRGGRGLANPNMFLLTCFPDCLGSPPMADYERCGLPLVSPQANHPETVRLEALEIAARFNNRIRAQMEIVRYTRNVGYRSQVVN